MGTGRALTGPLKNWVRKEIHRRGFELLADPFSTRLVRTLHWLDVDTVIDGGANVGQFGRILRSAGFTGRIHSIEPLSGAYAELAASAKPDPMWTVEHGALSDREGVVEINIAGNSVSSSILPMLAAHSDAAPESTYVGTESVRMVTVDSLVARLGIDPTRTMLKLDVQGYEAVALAGASGCIDRFAAAQVELSYVPLYDGSWLADELTAFLAKHGYQLWMYDPAAMYDPTTGRLLQCDGVFVRA